MVSNFAPWPAPVPHAPGHLRAAGIALGVALLGACSAQDASTGAVAVLDASVVSSVPDAGAPSLPPVTCTADNPFCMPSGQTPPPTPSCGETRIDLTPVGVNVMIAVDGSKAMANHWESLQNAIKKMIEENLSLNFGAHLFYADVADLEGILDNANFCGTTINTVLDVGPDQQTQILPFLGAAPPGPGSDYFSFRPVVEPLNYYLNNQTKLADPDSTNYLVFISNGADNCFGTVFARNEDKLLTYEKLAVELVKRNIRVLPIGFDGATAQKLPPVAGGGMLDTNFGALDTLAKFGGAGLDKALAADSTQELEEAIARVAQTVRTCRFSIPDALDPSKNLNPFALEFLVNSVPVPRDRTHAMGWDFVNGNTSQAEMFGEPCVAIRAGKEVTARSLCNTEEVCGTAATKLSTKPRAAEFLLDGSLSMLACSVEDRLQCLPPPLGMSALTWWGVAVRSVATTVVATINDDAEFGIQYLPGRGTGIGSCEPAAMPEVPPKDGSEIAVIRSALSTLPLGSTPLVSTLETIAANPGRIAEAGVSGALIVMSDGGNGCGDIDPDEAATRLGEAAKTLSDKGVKIFVIKMGSGDVPEEDAQLNAIAKNGGTKLSSKETAYLEAPTPEELDQILASLSDELASCDLNLGAPPADADDSKLNLYIDGELIPFDATGQKTEGWGFSDATHRALSMYGEACKRFKMTRSTSIVVEYGCPPVPVLL
jgi:hypothetical protein